MAKAPNSARASPFSAAGLAAASERAPRSVPPMIASPAVENASASQKRPLGRSRPVATPRMPSSSGVQVTSVTDAATDVSVSDETQAPKCSA